MGPNSVELIRQPEYQPRYSIRKAAKKAARELAKRSKNLARLNA